MYTGKDKNGKEDLKELYRLYQLDFCKAQILLFVWAPL